MKHIRPIEFFNHLPVDGHDVSYRIPFHAGRESETILALDTLLLISAIRIAKPRTFLELGTGLGYNALHLCLNTDVEITTIDSDDRSRVFSPRFDGRVKQVRSDVLEFSGKRPFDMVFCDINVPGVTEWCTKIAFEATPLVVAWHDYGHQTVTHVKPFLDSLDLPLIHVEDSLMVFWFRDGLD